MKCRALLSLSLLPLFLGALAQPIPRDYGKVTIPSGEVVLPIKSNGLHMPIVEVMVNGSGPYRFALDTCAAHGGAINSEIAEKLGAKAVGEVMVSDGTGKNPATRKIYGLSKLSVGGIQFDDVRMIEHKMSSAAAAAKDRRNIDGVLGFGLWKELLLSIDYPKAQVTLSRGELSKEESVPFQLGNGIVNVQLEVSGKKLNCHLDSGNEGGIVLPLAIAKDLPLDKEPVKIGQAHTVSNVIDIYGATLKGDLEVAGVKFENPKIEFSEIFRGANVGSRALFEYKVTIDQKNGLLKIAKGS